MSIEQHQITDLLLESQFLPQEEVLEKESQANWILLNQKPRDLFHCNTRPSNILAADESDNTNDIYLDFFLRPFTILPFQQKVVELVVIPHRTGLLKLCKTLLSVKNILQTYSLEGRFDFFEVKSEIGSLEIELVLEGKSFVFGEYKGMEVQVHNPTKRPIDNLWLMNDKPLDLGHVSRNLGSIPPGATKKFQMAVRATINERKGEINFLAVFETCGVLRSIFRKIGFTVASSFKTKCLLEQIDAEKYLVLIDLFDRKENFIQEPLFNVDQVVLLSDIFEIDHSDKSHFERFLYHSAHTSLLYFMLKRKPLSTPSLLRKNKQVFLNEANFYKQPLQALLEAKGQPSRGSDISAALSHPCRPMLKDKLLHGFLRQENLTVRNDIRKSSRPDLHEDYRCSDFIDFCLLWRQKVKIPDSNLFGGGRNPDRKRFREIRGQHSIINTAVNSISFKLKHSIEQMLSKKYPHVLKRRKVLSLDSGLRDPMYRVIIEHPDAVEHDFRDREVCIVNVKIRVICVYKGGHDFAKIQSNQREKKEQKDSETESERSKSFSKESKESSKSNEHSGKLNEMVDLLGEIDSPILDKVDSEATKTNTTNEKEQDTPIEKIYFPKLEKINNKIAGNYSRPKYLKDLVARLNKRKNGLTIKSERKCGENPQPPKPSQTNKEMDLQKKKPRKPQVIVKLSNLHMIEDTKSKSSSKSGKKKESKATCKNFPVMIWRGNRNISISDLQENHDVVIEKQIALFGPGTYDLNQLKLRNTDFRVLNLHSQEKCLLKVH